MAAEYVVNYADYAFSHNHLFDNCGIMLLKLVTNLGPVKLYWQGMMVLQMEVILPPNIWKKKFRLIIGRGIMKWES